MSTHPHTPEDLVDLVDQVLGGLGLDVRDAVRIADGHPAPDSVDSYVVAALRAGWCPPRHRDDDPAVAPEPASAPQDRS